MSQPIDRSGNFRGEITSYGLVESEGGSIGVSLDIAVYDYWNAETKTWDDWREYDLVASGCINIRKKDGTTNDTGVKGLARAGWDGSLVSITDETWKALPVAFTTEQDDYRMKKTGTVSYRVGFLNAYDSTPGGGGNVSADRARELQNKFGSQFRAAVGSVKQNTAKPAGAPQPPRTAPPKGVSPGQTKAANEAAKEAGDDGVPF